MTSPRSLLVVGPFKRKSLVELSVAASEAAAAAVAFDDLEHAAPWLVEHGPFCVVVPSQWAEVTATALELRAHTETSQVPLIGVGDPVDDLAFGDLFSWGGDDVVATGATRALLRRLRALPQEPPHPPQSARGRALVADDDRMRRIVLGRVLRAAGYAVTFAADARDAAAFAAESELVVLHAELDPERRLVVDSRTAGNTATWIVRSAPREQRSWRDSLSGIEGAACTDGFAPPENVLFLANELGNSKRQNNRASPRLLYGTTVAFRGAGRDSDDLGYSYNISEGGLYVRTLAPPDDDRVWVELCPPRSERRVRLTGRVVWRRGFGGGQFATVPPGFGVQIVDGAREDLELWQAGYRAFAEAVG